MIYGLERYEELIDSILSRTPLLRTMQLKVMVYRYFKYYEEDEGMSSDLAEDIIFACQRMGKLLLSEDGWAMTKTQYKRLLCSHEDEHIDTHTTFRLGKMDDLCRNYYPEIIALMWVVAYDFPRAKNYVIGRYPYSINYIPIVVDEEKQKENASLYQMCYIKSSEELATYQLLYNVSEVDDKFKPVVRRIALFEDDTLADELVRVGFNYILKVDETKPSHYTKIGTRKLSEAWADYNDK